MKEKWISVDDRLPEKSYDFGGTGFSEDVLVIDKDGDIYLTSYVYPWRSSYLTGFNESEQDGLVKEDVTHWMPLPPPPEKLNHET